MHGNSRSAIRGKVHADELVSANTPGILRGRNKPSMFCITIDRDNNIISVSVAGKPPFLTYQGPFLRPIRYIGFAMGTGDTPARFYFPEAMTGPPVGKYTNPKYASDDC